ncbi:MAG TPA: HPF/RaiA family ribosome-associated protein [Burkholderiaceae bacterium]|nr:HPF/RaiA family ribosome-associated protein [Burkholderiaceae bacterium]
MKLPLEIVFREMLPLPSLEPEIRRRVAKFERFGGELMSCRIVVEAAANRRRQGHEYRVTIDVRVPDDELAVSQHHRGDDAQRVLRDAFDAMDRHLDERQRQRRDGPRHPAQGPGLR